MIEKDNGLWIEELFGGTKKEFFSKFDEELDYERPGTATGLLISSD